MAPAEFSFHREEVPHTPSPPLYDVHQHDHDDRRGDEDDEKATYISLKTASGCKTTWPVFQTQWTSQLKHSKYAEDEDTAVADDRDVDIQDYRDEDDIDEYDHDDNSDDTDD